MRPISILAVNMGATNTVGPYYKQFDDGFGGDLDSEGTERQGHRLLDFDLSSGLLFLGSRVFEYAISSTMGFFREPISRILSSRMPKSDLFFSFTS